MLIGNSDGKKKYSDNYRIFDVASAEWRDWRWQQRNTIREEASLREACGGWSDELSSHIQSNLNGRKLQITPYYLRLIRESQGDTDADIVRNPLWRQVVPFWSDEIVGGYDGESENWELAHEMKTPICQHKYDNRVILRMVNTCNSYCQFCFEALRTLEVNSEKTNASRDTFGESVAYIKQNPAIEEVILSGGDPLMLSDAKLDEHLSALRDVGRDLLIRIHSRSLTFNPYRVTDQLVAMLDRHRVNAFGVHVCHPDELSPAFTDAVKRIRSAVPIVFSNMPFLRGINDDEETLHRLFIELYRRGVKPYYLYHFMPFSPGASVYKASIRDAIRIMNRLKRRVSNVAMPEYVLPHAKGKFTVPLFEGQGDIPQFVETGEQRIYRFVNWQGETCDWIDN
ncbi:radical SAM protein [Burkholderia cenocepacia]|uniref:KamA family radical SAM protein n=1 Tax=Burkholderia TaxID=32008 RepID=UPI0003C4640B|nr:MULTISPECIES: radical SAM protein [Burkholderia]ESS41204.1 Lysine 2,3-aminomutase [Burkholderia cenocepacia KC-01]ELK7720535.1 radical SAM protein [Burkholderia cenocepacia]MBL3961518.1 radical SAM protein [Burkholderia sp. KCJ3K979]MBR8307192.1 radical SAM protein [Burkholderia cenocepacia]MCA7963629.1 radical SAM protein [Burkholderia cenocepacia]